MHKRVSVSSIGFGATPLATQAGYWKEIGNYRVGLMEHQLRGAENLAAGKAALATGDYKVATLVHPFILGGHIQTDPSTWEKPRAALSATIKLAKDIGAETIYMTTGGHGTLTWEEAAEAFSAAIAPCVPEAKAAGIPLLIETTVQLNTDLHLVHTLRDATLLAEMAGIGVNIDIFASWQEAGLKETIKRCMPICHLVQVSDYTYGDRTTPGRTVPGDGVINLKRYLGWLLDAGYKGAFDLELIGPRIEKEGAYQATRRAAEWTSKVLEELGA
jgi:sugar phosphate isomerase/epimerase